VYTQDFDPVSSSLGLSSIFAVLPVLTLFVLLGGVRLAAQWASLIALGVAMLVALIVYGMPIDQTLLSASEGATFGLFPIMWIVVTAIWIYNMTVETGHFAVLRRSFGAISTDQRVQAVIIAFCFGALLEALAGFGTPVAITAVMLIALGFQPIKAAALRSWPTRHRWPSAPSPSPSSPWPRSPVCPRRTSGRWWGVRRRSWP
jgi:lactate permease